jgi:hypothetical protein
VTLYERILRRLAAWAQRVDRRLGEPAFNPKPGPPELPKCGGCMAPIYELLEEATRIDGFYYHDVDCYLMLPAPIRRIRAKQADVRFGKFPAPVGDPR